MFLQKWNTGFLISQMILQRGLFFMEKKLNSGLDKINITRSIIILKNAINFINQSGCSPNQRLLRLPTFELHKSCGEAEYTADEYQ